MRALFVFGGDPDDASNRYRCQQLCETLGRAGATPQWASSRQSAVEVAHDLVVVHRLPWGAARRWVEAARKIGAGVLFGADDLVFESDFAYQAGMQHPDDPLPYRAARRSVAGMREAISSCDGVLVSTRYLAREVESLGKPAIVVRNYPGEEVLALSASAREARARRVTVRTDDSVLLGYFSGSATHNGDLAAQAPAIAAALERRPGARLLLVGEVALPGPLAPFAAAGRVLRHPLIPWRDLPGLLASVDINLAPLDLTRPFCHAKSEVKWLEAAAVGIPTVASAAAGLAETLSEADGCLLAATGEAFFEALDGLLCDPTRRLSLGEAALTSLARRKEAAQTLAALSPFARPAQGSVVVRTPLKETLWRRIWSAEASFFRRWHYLRRHLREASHQQRHGGSIR